MSQESLVISSSLALWVQWEDPSLAMILVFLVSLSFVQSTVNLIPLYSPSQVVCSSVLKTDYI